MSKKLDQIPIDKIRKNPANPRLLFRQEELDELQESIRLYGIQVPIAVYKDGNSYVLIDGERRWRCASKLNHSTVPAIIQDRPSDLDNLLLMFNIHSLREQWDLLTVAIKLPDVISMLRQKSGKEPTEAELSNATGLVRGVIRRCKLLIELPSKYKDMLLEELKKPKTKQKLSEDLFIEMERSLKTVKRAMPKVLKDMDEARDILIHKYQTGIINNIVDFRKLAKIARAESVGADRKAAEAAMRKLVTQKTYSIDEAYNDTVSDVYAERDIVSRIDALLSRLESASEDAIDDDVRERLEALIERAKALLEDQ